ncbi:XRE family transcriptional regulator [Nakamurella silvestris]|nr:XRE family transcriptional regulator [Nakamurella silvestris]
MDNRNDIREFLTTRRARLTPEQAGLPTFGGHRRVPGLRREEVALLAGVSIDYYTRLERGNLSGVSEGVLESLARALQLDEAEHEHLFALARAAGSATRPSRRPGPEKIRPSVQRLLDAMTGAPAYVRNGRLDVLAANTLGRALYAPIIGSSPLPANTARFVFLNPRSPDFYPDWDRVAGDVVAILRASAGANPYDKALSDLVGELSTRSEDFRVRWASHNVQFHRTGVKRLQHPVVGYLELTFESLDLPADPGLRITTYTAEPNTPSADGLSLLASWSATLEPSAEVSAESD